MIQRWLLTMIAILLIDKIIIKVSASWKQHNDMRTDKLIMLSSGSFTAASIPLSFNVTYSGTLNTAAKSAGIGVVGFQTQTTVDFSVNISIASLTTSACRLTLQAYGDTHLKLYVINWIVVGNSVDFAEIQFTCFLCSNINKGNGLRQERQTGTTFFVGYNQLLVNVYLSGFWMKNSIGLINYLQAIATIPSGTNTINYVFTTNQNNTISQLCYTTIIVCPKCTEEKYYDYPTTGNWTYTNTTAPTFSFPADPDYKASDRMFFGMSKFQLSRAISRYFTLDTLDHTNLPSSGTVYNTNYGTYSVRIDYFWQARRDCPTPGNTMFNIYTLQCINNCNAPTPNLYPNALYDFCSNCHSTCDGCTGSLPSQCSACDSTFFRVINTTNYCPCMSSYVDIGQVRCYPCITFIAGCDTCISRYLCQTCHPGFVLNASGLCQCTSGHLVSGVCTNITGCISLVSYGGNNYCTACNAALNFQTNSNFTCSCMAGYYFNSYSLCSPLCGDGEQAPQEDCDDGNTINEDGCSSSCDIETNWMCVNGSVTSPSVCYVDIDFDLSVAYVRRVESVNQMEVALQITPIVAQLAEINFQKYLTTNVPNSGYTATYSNGVITILFDYNQTIQGNNYNVSLTLDPNYFYNAKLSTAVSASGMNAKLTYDSYNQVNYPMKIVVIILDCLAIIVMFLSCISERMIGIQLIQTIQIVLFAQTVMKATPSSFMPLQMLRYASGYNEIEGIDYKRTYTFGFSLSAVGLQKQFLLSYNLMYGLLIAVCVVCVFLKAKQVFHENQVGKFMDHSEEMKNQEKWDKTTKIFNFLFERILFLVAFMCMFLIVFALMLQMTDMQAKYRMVSKQFNLFGAIIAIAIIITMICGVILNGFFPGTLLFPMLMKQYYPPVYFLYQTAFIFLLAFDYTQQYILYILEGMSFLFLIFNLAYRPYPQRLHTFVLAFHQLFIMGVIGIYIFENLNTPNENELMYKIINVVIVVIMYVIVGLNAYRLYRYYNFLNINGWDQYGNPQNFYEGEAFDFTDYKNLVTPKDRPLKKGDNQNHYQTRNPNDQGKKSRVKYDRELQEIKRPSKDKKKSKPSVQDDSTIKWNYNQITDEENLGNTSSRYPPTSRDIKPDASREEDPNLKRVKTNEKLNKSNDNSILKPSQLDQDNEITIKDLDAVNNKPRGKTISQSPNIIVSAQPDAVNDNDIIFDNPYDEKGYTKSSSKKGKKEEEDPLKVIKRKLRQDFESKLKSSTLKQV